MESMSLAIVSITRNFAFTPWLDFGLPAGSIYREYPKS